MMSAIKRGLVCLATAGVAFGMSAASANATVPIQPSRGTVVTGGWPNPGGCGWLDCGTVQNNARSVQEIVLVKNWRWGESTTLSAVQADPSNYTWLSPGYTFGAPQGYDVDGFCVYKNARAWWNGQPVWGESQGWCKKIMGVAFTMWKSGAPEVGELLPASFAIRLIPLPANNTRRSASVNKGEF